MGRLITIILILISFVGYSQTYSMKDSRSGDIVQRIIQTTKTDGIVKYLFITGTDTAEIRWDGTDLTIKDINVADSITELRTEINNTPFTTLGNYIYPRTLTNSVGIGTATPSAILEVNGNTKVSDTIIAKAYKLSDLQIGILFSTDAGTRGEIRFGQKYIYVCVGTNEWKRVAISTW